MSLLETGMKMASGKMPKMISPTAHAIIDYAIAGSFFIAAAFFWRRNRSAALAAVTCGLAEVATAALTEYPGGLQPIISFGHHERLDGGIASLVGTMPILFNFADEPEAKVFRAQGIAIAAATALTAFEGEALTSWRDVA